MTLLEKWEEQFKKGQLTLWILLSLVDGEKSAEEIILFVEELSEHAYSFDIQSTYRSLRNFVEMELIMFKSEKSSKGPERKVYTLTESGHNLLHEFYERNLRVFTSPTFLHVISKIKKTA